MKLFLTNKTQIDLFNIFKGNLIQLDIDIAESSDIPNTLKSYDKDNKSWTLLKSINNTSIYKREDNKYFLYI